MGELHILGKNLHSVKCASPGAPVLLNWKRKMRYDQGVLGVEESCQSQN